MMGLDISDDEGKDERSGRSQQEENSMILDKVDDKKLHFF